MQYVVPDIIPSGLTLVAGKPKIGKSWLALDLCLSVAHGGFTLGDRHCIKGAVLYAALEDSERRLKLRLQKTARADPWPDNLDLWTEMKPLEDGGLDQLRQWIATAEDPRLIDRHIPEGPQHQADQRVDYEADYRQAGALKQLSDETGVAIMVTHHVRKMDAEDPLDLVSGTTGLTAAVDTVLVFKREGGGVTLYGLGRDIEALELAVSLDKRTCRWSVLGDADEVRVSSERRAILDALAKAGEPMTAKLVSDVTGQSYHSAASCSSKCSSLARFLRLQGANSANPGTSQ